LVNDLGAEINQIFSYLLTPVYVAARQGRLIVVCCLVKELGADVNLSCRNGSTPLHIAAQVGHLDMVRYLVKELGAVVNKAKQDGVTPLSVAAQCRHLALVRYLVKELGADVNHAEENGATPLFITAQMEHVDVVRCLVSEHDADVNQARHNGFTPLMMAVKKNNQVLVHKGANVRAVSRSGKTAITCLKQAGATAAQITYLEVRECCANPGCDGGGRKRCTVCKETRYGGKPCQIAHWCVHRMCCRRTLNDTSERNVVAVAP
jgi:ankyrin repeat protein